MTNLAIAYQLQGELPQAARLEREALRIAREVGDLWGVVRNAKHQSRGVVGMMDLATEVVTAIASGAGGSIGAKGAEAVGKLIAALRAKFRGLPQARGALEISLESPDDAAARDQLTSVLRDHIRDSVEFAEWLASLWAEVQPDLRADSSNSANVITGTVHGSVVQARDVHGSIHLGGA